MDDSGLLSLDSVLRQHEASRQQLATKLLYDAARALSVMHSAGTVHGDLRCEHILVSPDHQTVKLSGLAHSFDWNALRYHVMASDKTAAQAGVSVSSAVRWLGPECVAGGIPTPASDVYALGLTVYEALTGQVPFESKGDAQVVELKNMTDTQLPDQRPDKIGREAWLLIQDACHHNPIFRPSIQIVTMTLRTLHSSGAVQATAMSPTVHVYAPVVPTPPQLTLSNAVGTLTQVYPLGQQPPLQAPYPYPTGQAHPVVGQQGTMVYQYPAATPAGMALPTPVAYHKPMQMNDIPPYAAPPSAQQQAASETPTWKKVARVVVVSIIAVSIAVPASLFSHSSSDPYPTTRGSQAPTTPPLTSSNTNVATIQDGFGSSWVKALTVAQDGSIYASDGHAIFRLYDDGSQASVVAGSSYGYQNGPATDALFGFVQGLAVDNHGNVLVADDGNHRLRIVHVDASPPTVANVAGDGSRGNRNDTLLAASFYGMSGVAVDNMANVYIASGDCVRKVSLSQGQVLTLEHNFQYAIPVAVSPTTNDVYVGTSSSIVRISADGKSSSVVTGTFGTHGYHDGAAANAEFGVVLGLAFSPSGENLYISDTFNNCIRAYNVATNQVSTLGGQCGLVPAYVDGAATIARFSQPAGISVGPDGTVYVGEYGASYGRVRRIKRGQ